MAQQWKALGLDVELQIVEWGTWLDRVYTQRDYDVSVIGLAGRLIPTRSWCYTTGNSRNFFNFSNERYDELIEEDSGPTAMSAAVFTWRLRRFGERTARCLCYGSAPAGGHGQAGIQGFRNYPTYVVDVAGLYR